MSGMISTMTVNADAVAACEVGHLAATDVADYLAKRGMPFREAHAVVGHLVLECDKRGCQLDDLPLEVFEGGEPAVWRGHHLCLDIDAIVAARTTQGGTAPMVGAQQMRLCSVRPTPRTRPIWKDCPTSSPWDRARSVCFTS